MNHSIPDAIQARNSKIQNHLAFDAILGLARDYGLGYEFIQSYKKRRKLRYSISDAMSYAAWEWDI